MTDYFDSGREREFNTYYDAYRALSNSEPPYTDLYDAEAAARHEPKLAPDPTITAFCQLGALRLNTKRCMVFFFDQTNGYVLAESTQSHHSGHAGDLWLGNTIIPRGLSVCEHTVNIPEGNKGSNRHDKNAGEVHVINNFLEDQRFCDRPYVTDAPHARFYAGVPIRTESGACIGAYCVLDDAPRDGVSDEEVDFLKHMADLVMRHLGDLRRSAEFGRGARMLQGLGVITRHDEEAEQAVEGVADRTGEKRSRRRPKELNTTERSTHPSIRTPMLSEYASDFAAETDHICRSRQASRKQRNSHTSGSASASDESGANTQPSTCAGSEDSALPPPLARAPDSNQSTSSYHTDGNDANNTLDRQIRQSFQRASSLLLDAVKSDGVVFLDATAARSASDNVTSRRFSGQGDRSTDESDSSNSSNSPSVISSGVKCDVLGHSEIDGIGGVPSFDNMITERFLKSLMRRYPKGKTWTFDADGQESSERFLQDLAKSVPNSDNATSGTISRTLRETPKLQRLFSLGLRTLCFAPMWDPVRERWYAAALTWSKSPQHGFSKTSELSYLNAFCDVTMAEILRIESKQEAKSRATLMSSFSHDLRSPLHGILGSIDLLKGNGTLDWSLVEQVQKCSLNLVDVIDHLLDFAQINNKAPPRRLSDNRRDHEVNSVPASNKTSSCVSLGRTTEAIVDAVFYSHYFTKHDRTQPHVDLVMDLSPQSDIRCIISVGAWKRLCTNIVNNALKYTPGGHVKVSLDTSARESGVKYATLIVSDTGIGMSPEFLKESLFKSFAQEDSFAMGTGLGMSLVAELIKEFRGTIEVNSRKGEGTTMTVTIPLEMPQDGAGPEPGCELECPNACVGYFEPPRDEQESITNSRQALINAAKQTLRNIGVKTASPNDAGIIAIFEEHFEKIADNVQTDEHCWLVFCDSFASATRLRERYQYAHAEFLPQPYGPERLSTALHVLCKSLSEQTVAGAAAKSTQREAIEKRETSPRHPRSRAMSTLPSPPLDVTLDYLTLSSPNAATTKAAIQVVYADEGSEITSRASSSSSGVASADGPNLTESLPGKPSSTAEPSQNSDPLLLLLVDDNPINLKLLTMVADRNHYPRLLATNGEEAVNAYKSPETAASTTKHSGQKARSTPNRRPDIVLLDLNMPIMNGFEAARQIRQFEKQTGAPPAVIVAITGLGDDIARAKAYQHGFNFFMSKPVRPGDVTQMLESIVQAKNTEAKTADS